MSKNNFGIKESLTIKDSRGNVVRSPYTGSLGQRIRTFLGIETCCDDIVVDGGLADIADMITDRYGYIGFGTGTTAPTHEDTALESPLGSRSAVTTSISTTFYTNDTAVFNADFTAASDCNISEAILCVLASAGTGDVVFARETFSPYSMVARQTITAIWEVVVMR